MPNYAILRMEKIKSVTKGGARLKHNRRQIECPTANKEKENKTLLVSPTAKEDKKKSFKEMFKERVGDQRIRKNAVHAIEVVMTFSPGAILGEENIKKWAFDSVRWLADTFGGRQNVVDSQLHLDEATPHIHSIVIPIDEKGKLNAREFLGGTRNRMVELQTKYAEAMKEHGLERGISKQITKAQHKASTKYHAEQAEKESRLQAYETVFGTEKEWDFDKFVKFNVALDEHRQAAALDVPGERSEASRIDLGEERI